jgi:hypothetical protein
MDFVFDELVNDRKAKTLTARNSQDARCGTGWLQTRWSCAINQTHCDSTHGLSIVVLLILGAAHTHLMF